MAWLTTEDGRKVNTDWFSEDEKKKYAQIEANQKEADKLNGKEDKPSENKYGFEVYNKNPEVEFTDAHWKKMAQLRKKGKFYDSDLSRKVDDKLYELQENAGDDVLSMYDKMQEDRVTDDEYWAGYHAIAEWLKIKK